jgi:hypothetical protein
MSAKRKIKSNSALESQIKATLSAYLDTKVGSDSMSVMQARALAVKHCLDGSLCKTCAQNMQVYTRHITSAMARILVLISPVHGWVHVQDYVRKHIGSTKWGKGTVGGDYAKLALWGLIEPRGDDPGPKKKDSGYWRVTDNGRLFASGAVTLIEHVVIYNGVSAAFVGDQITIQHALGADFDYGELMAASRKLLT